VLHTFGIYNSIKKKIALRNKPGGGINRFVTVVLHGGGGGVQMWPKSCYVICEWPHTSGSVRLGSLWHKHALWLFRGRVIAQGKVRLDAVQ